MLGPFAGPTRATPVPSNALSTDSDQIARALESTLWESRERTEQADPNGQGCATENRPKERRI
jgi:hypothetical protein